MTGLKLTGKRLSKLPAYEPYWCEIWGRVALTGQSERLERYSAATKVWYDFYIFKPNSGDTNSRRVAVIFRNITERHDWEERQKVLIAELQHRTGNILGLVQSLADKTLQQSSDLAGFSSRYGVRLQALARTQRLLANKNGVTRVRFGNLLQTELAAVHGSPDQINLDGADDLELRSSTVQILALAIHELATNAVKHGGLSTPAGQLHVAWSVNKEKGEEWLTMEWIEQADRPLEKNPHHAGQGRELIEQGVPYQLGGRVKFELDTSGLHCVLSFPINGRG